MATLETTAPPLPRVFPLAEAARRMGVSEAALRNMIQSGQIPAFQGPDGQMLVPMTTTEDKPAVLPLVAATSSSPPQTDSEDGDINARLSQIRREDFAHLEGVPITVSEAARKYGVSVQTLHNWIKKGYITPLRRGTSKNNPTICNEAEIAYCAQIYEVRKLFGVRFGAPLLNADGTPYLLKHPGLSLYRRQQQP